MRMSGQTAVFSCRVLAAATKGTSETEVPALLLWEPYGYSI